MAVIDGTVKVNERDKDLVLVRGGLVRGGQQIVVMVDGKVNVNVLDADLVLESGGQNMAVIDGTVKMNMHATFFW